MKKKLFIDDLLEKLCHSLPSNLQHVKKDIEKNFQHVLLATFDKLELVTRDEFAAQTKVLARTRKKIDDLEKEIAKMELMLQEKSRQK